MEAFIHALRKRRALLLSPTASGKSLIIYMIVRALEQNTLIIVPTIGLVKQMYTDLISYGCPEDMLHKIEAGGPKEGKGTITITTWQSIYKMPKKWFDQFSVIIGDEAHQYKANSLKGIMEKCTLAPYKIGLTGTLDGTPTHKLVLEGLFGGVKRVTDTSTLMDEGKIAQLKIKAIVLAYPEHERKDLAKIARKDYHAEIDWLIAHQRRNKFIKNLACSLEGNTLVLFRRVEDHGEVLYNLIKEKVPDRDVFFIHGTVDGEEREEVRALTEKSTNAIIVASQGTFSTGTNIRNLHNVIFVHPSKSKILVLQSIGRALRISDTKSAATLYDIADDLHWGSWKNTTLRHFVERLEMYVKEKFDFKTYTVKLEQKQ
jgi:superfamily II DNA or RNA helicase